MGNASKGVYKTICLNKMMIKMILQISPATKEKLKSRTENLILRYWCGINGVMKGIRNSNGMLVYCRDLEFLVKTFR